MHVICMHTVVRMYLSTVDTLYTVVRKHLSTVDTLYTVVCMYLSTVVHMYLSTVDTLYTVVCMYLSTVVHMYLFTVDTLYTVVHTYLSTVDTLGPEKRLAIQRFPLCRGYFTCSTLHLNPQSVVERLQYLGSLLWEVPLDVCECTYVYT